MSNRPTSEHVDRMTSQSGWLQDYLLSVDQIIQGRWSWWLSVLVRGFVGDDEIPRVEFRNLIAGGGECDAQIAHAKAFFESKGCVADDASVSKLIGSRGANVATVLRVFRRAYERGVSVHDCARWWLWGFGSRAVEERPSLPEEIAVSMYHEVGLQHFLSSPGDWGALLANEYYGDRAKRHSAWFPTPVEVCECMVAMQMQGGDNRFKTVMDPCVGTGPMLLCASNHSLRLYGCDIDPVMCALCELNAWLFVPWLAVPGCTVVREFVEAEAANGQPVAADDGGGHESRPASAIAVVSPDVPPPAADVTIERVRQMELFSS